MKQHFLMPKIKRKALESIFYSLLLITLTFCSGVSNARADQNVRLLIVMGGGTYESSVFRFYDMLDGIDYHLVMSDEEAFSEAITDTYDAVLMYNLNTSLGEPARTHLTHFLENGGGLVVWHHALANYGDWPWWYQEVVGARYVLRATEELPASRYRQDESVVASVAKDHPVVSSLQGHPMHYYDETYQQLWFADNIEVLLRTSLSSSDEPIVWLGPYKKSKVVVIQPGHGSGAYYNLGFRMIMQNAIHWVSQ